ncbi:hypothetical protein EYF80_005708 [Liparis tanakae]|uniref:Uncharacterized protein n=1 Tax=Liparis tanakae TaxID=230148 RepID=A0A4Z2J3S0_9TELE|nr:hypothetical protein EYF80_005708 [Liparis tanakae]
MNLIKRRLGTHPGPNLVSDTSSVSSHAAARRSAGGEPRQHKQAAGSRRAARFPGESRATVCPLGGSGRWQRRLHSSGSDEGNWARLGNRSPDLRSALSQNRTAN